MTYLNFTTRGRCCNGRVRKPDLLGFDSTEDGVPPSQNDREDHRYYSGRDTTEDRIRFKTVNDCSYLPAISSLRTSVSDGSFGSVPLCGPNEVLRSTESLFRQVCRSLFVDREERRSYNCESERKGPDSLRRHRDPSCGRTRASASVTVLRPLISPRKDEELVMEKTGVLGSRV